MAAQNFCTYTRKEPIHIMKIVCSKSSLLNGVQTVSKAVPNKTTMSILECILVDTRTGEIKLTANDMELGIETVIDGEIIEKGIIALDAKIFLEIVRKLRIMISRLRRMILLRRPLPVKRPNLTLSGNQEKISLSCRRSRRMTA